MKSTPPHTLTYVQPLFLEQQLTRDVYPRVLMLVAIGSLWPSLILLTLTVFGQRGVATAMLPGMAIAQIVMLAIASMMRFTSATTIVETTAIQLQLAVFGRRFWRRTIPMHRVQRADLTNTTGQLSVLKHGVGELFFMTRRTSVRVHLPEFNYVLIGSMTPEKLCDAIQTAITTSIEANGERADCDRETGRADRSRAS